MKDFIKTIVTFFSICTVVTFLAIGIGLCERYSDKETWNHGICSYCGEKYHFTNTEKTTANGSTYYFYACDNCGEVIRLYHEMRYE